MRVHIAAVLFAVVAGGCYASTGVGYSAGYVEPAPVYTTTTVTVESDAYGPDLVEAEGGVQVIADYDEPVFYSDNYYWRFNGGLWYRSNVHTGGWVVYNDVPHRVRRIDRPYRYARYRPQGYVPRRERVRDHRDPYRRDQYRRDPQPTVRDHRDPYRPAPQPTVRDHRDPYRQPAPQPTVRDHRQPAPQPTVRDHRDQRDQRDYRQPAPQPTVRDHRSAPPARDSRPTTRDHRDKDDDDNRRRSRRD